MTNKISFIRAYMCILISICLHGFLCHFIFFCIFIFKNHLHTYFWLVIIYIRIQRISKIKRWEHLSPVLSLRRREVLPVRWCHFLCKDHSPCHQVLSELVSIPLPAVTSPLLDISYFRGITTLLGTNPRTLCCSTWFSYILLTPHK